MFHMSLQVNECRGVIFFNVVSPVGIFHKKERKEAKS
jgi:hypothetical protein